MGCYSWYGLERPDQNHLILWVHLSKPARGPSLLRMPRLRLRLAAFSPLFPFSSPSPPSHFAHLAVTTIELRPYSGMRSGGWGKAWSLSRDNVKVWAENQWYHWLRTYLWSELGMKFDHDSGLYWIWLKNEENRNMRQYLHGDPKLISAPLAPTCSFMHKLVKTASRC